MAIHLMKLLRITKTCHINYAANYLISKRNVQEFPGLKLNNELPKDYLLILPETLNEKPDSNEVIRLPRVGENETNFKSITPESLYKGFSQTILSFENYVSDINDQVITLSEDTSLEKLFKDIEEHLYPMDTVSNILCALMNVDQNNYQHKEIYDLLIRYYAVRELRFGPVFKDSFGKYANEKFDSLSSADKKLLNIYYPYRRTLTSIDESTLNHFKKHLQDDINQFRSNVRGANQLFSHTVDDPDILAKVSSRFIQNQDLHHKERTPLKININTYKRFMDVCPDRFVRQNLWQVCNKRCSPKAYTKYNNISYINNIRLMRKKIADLSGYRSHLEYRLNNAMAKSKQEILDNLASLSERNSKILTERVQELNDFAADNSHEDYGQSGLQEYDIDYWCHKYIYEILIGKSENELKSFFPLSKVMSGLRKYFIDYFDIEIKEIVEGKEKLWSTKTTVYDVIRKNKHIGTMIHDPYMSDNKSSLDPFYARLRGRNNQLNCLPLRLISTSYLIDNKTKQAQLSITEVINLFNCYATVIQRLLYNYKYYELNTYGGLEVDVNNFFSNLCLSHLLTDHKILQSCSERGNSKSIDTETSQQILKALTYFKSFNTWRDLYKAHLDIEAHSSLSDIRTIGQETYSLYSPFQRDPNDFDYCAMSEIFAGANDAVQYGNLWSKQLVNYYLNNDDDNLEQQHTKIPSKDLNIKLLDELFHEENFNTKDRLLSLLGRSFEPSKTGLGVL